MAASVSNLNAIKPHIDKENFFDDGRDFIIEVFQNGKNNTVRIFEKDGPQRQVIVYRQEFKPDTQPAELLTLAKQWISTYVTVQKNTPLELNNKVIKKKP